MSTLQIHLFGGLDVSRGDNRLPPFPTQKARSLFAYLVLNRSRAHSRDSLVGVFWGERPETVAKKCLRTDIWRVRHALSDADEVLLLKDHKIAFNADFPHWIDVAEFEKLIGAVRSVDPCEMTPEEVRSLEAAVSLYRGDLMEGMYDDWFLYERERMRLLYLTSLERLMNYRQSREDWAGAADLGQRLLATDPLREHVHRELIRCYYRQGNRPEALRQFERCATILRSELDIEPMAETRQLWEEIRQESLTPVAVAPTPSPAPSPFDDLASCRASLDSAFRSLAVVTREMEELRRALEAVEMSARQKV